MNQTLEQLDRDAINIIRQTTKINSPQNTDERCVGEIDTLNRLILESLTLTYPQLVEKKMQWNLNYFCQPIFKYHLTKERRSDLLLLLNSSMKISCLIFTIS